MVIADRAEAGFPILYANPAFYEYLGQTERDSGSLADFFEDAQCFPYPFSELRQEIADGHPVELRCKANSPDPDKNWVRVNISTLDSDQSHLMGIVTDESDHRREIENLRSERLEVEERLIERSQALERINQDLEGFTFSVSHDLRAPLRAIMGFSKMLVEDHGQGINGEMRQTLDRINAAASRMATIIEDLLTFSRLGRKEFVRRRINLSQIAHSICADIKKRHPDRDTEFRIDDDQVIDGDPTLIRMALENLLDNASKFTSKTKNGLVEFRQTGTRQFLVKDNGAGFDPQYSDKLFRPFERLHSASEYPGTGIGLANVQRIIERHGGKIWAEGKPGEGASFHFTL
jgi:signal transduction histidine kinase